MPKAELDNQPSAFSEPSEPADVSPEDKRAQITNPQEENPQAVVRKQGAGGSGGARRSEKGGKKENGPEGPRSSKSKL